MKTKTCDDNSFFNVFEYSVLMHDAIDKGLVYEDITIQRDITTISGLRLQKGRKFDAVWLLFDVKGEVEVYFINWVKKDSGRNSASPKGRAGDYMPGEDSVLIPMKELVQFLVWSFDSP